MVFDLGLLCLDAEKEEISVKVLFFSHQSDFIYGGEVSTLAFMKSLRALGVEVHLAAPEGIFAERAAAYATVHTVPAVQFSRNLTHLPALLPSLWGSARALAKIVREQKIDVVHAMSLKAMAYVFHVKAPVFWHHHDILPAGAVNHAWLRLFAARAKKILVPSRASRAALLEAGVAAAKVEILPNGLEGGEWSARPARTPGQTFVVGFVGELSERKGIDRLPELVEGLEAAGIKNFAFRVIGEGLSSPEFARELKEKFRGREATVKFLGRREDVKPLLQEIDALWVPSRQEPFGIVLIEAAFSGLPVVAAPVGGIPEIVIEGQTGYLPTDMKATVAAFGALQDVAQWRMMATQARKHAERFDMAALGRRLLALYREASDASP